jgi:hypothetical protein
MKSKQLPFFQPLLREWMTITAVDQLFLNHFKELLQGGCIQKILAYIQGCQDLSIIIKIAEIDKEFLLFCKQDILREHWERIWCSYGLILSRKTPFFVHPEFCQFDLVRGVFFYHQAQKARNQTTIPFLFTEIEFLKKSKTYQSIHGIQAYHRFLYNECEQNQNTDKVKAFFEEIIQDSANLVIFYGSYAYLMLAEAYYRYANWHLTYGDEDAANYYYDSAIVACNYSEQCISESYYSIHNASLGLGLKASNSFGTETPQEMRNFITCNRDKKLAFSMNNNLFSA